MPIPATRPSRPSRSAGCSRDEGIGHYEEPCPYWEFEQTKEVADALDIDVTGGEQDCEFTAWEQMIGMRAVDIIQPDIMYLGGITPHAPCGADGGRGGTALHAARANLSLVTMCTMHLLGAIPNAGKYLEFSIEGDDYYPWQEGLFLGDPYPCRGRARDDYRRARLGRGDRSGMAGEGGIQGQRDRRISSATQDPRTGWRS